MELKGKKVIILVEQMYNDLEFWYPYYRLKEAGAEVTVVGSGTEVTYTGKSGIPCVVDTEAEKISVTAFFAIKDDLTHAGANYVDQEVVVDGKLITSRKPDDLPAFMKAVIAAL